MRKFAKAAVFILICCSLGPALCLERTAALADRAEDYPGSGYDPGSYLEDYIRVRADLAGTETVYYWTGMAYGLLPGEKRRELFAVAGYNITRAVRKEDGFDLLAREVILWLDHRTGQILETWRNPFTGKDLPVFQVFNDPVNQDLGFNPENLSLLPMYLPCTDLGEQVAWHAEIFPYYSNPLPRKLFPLNSQSDTFQSGEFSQFIVPKSALAETGLSSLPAVYTRTEILPWLPFMEMGDRPGNVVLICRGSKLERGFDALPEQIREYVNKLRPEFASAPLVFSEPNASLWTAFRAQKELEQKALDSESLPAKEK